MDLEKEVLSLRTEDAVATVGRWLFEPNTVNSVPRKAQLEIDVRDTKKDRRDHMVDFVLRDAQRIASHRKVCLCGHLGL
jgi:ureidoglycolate amidohydrolase